MSLNGGSIMRLWKALHTSFRGKKGVRRADCRTRLEVEALDQRLLPTSFQWGIGRGIALLSWDLGTQKAGALVSSHQVSGSGQLVNRPAHAPAGIHHVPTESISINFPTTSRFSFSWGEVGSPD
jgi:hypothetical protein